MQRNVLATVFCLLVACSASTKREGVGADDDSDDDATEEPATAADGGSERDAAKGASGSRDAGVRDDDDQTPGKSAEPDFSECAEKSVDAERGPRGSNIVWVVDNSGSMDEEAALVQQNLNAFVTSIAAAGLADYRVVLITEDGFVQVPAPLGTDREHFLAIDEDVGSEEPLSDLLTRYGDFSGFLLPGVVTHFITVTDDESEITAQNFATNMKLKLGSEFRVHSIASPPGDTSASGGGSWFDDDEDEGCSGRFGAAAAPGVQHWEVSKLTSGLTFSICSEDWSKLFSELAKKVEESAAVPCSVELPEPPPGESIDPRLINVVYSAPGTNKGDPLPRVDSVAACGDKSSWYYDNPAAPTRILLCEKACSAAGNGGSLKIALGCETFVQ